MFHHTVLMQLTGTDADFLAQVADYESRILAELDYVRAYHFGSNLASRARHFQWVVISMFDNAADHDRYQVSTIHQQMKAFMAPHIEDIVVCDFDSDHPRVDG